MHSLLYLSRRSDIDYQESREDEGTRPDAAAAGKTPARTAATTFTAFVLAGWAPLLPYLLAVEPLFPLSIAVTGVAFFTVGASRSLVTDRGWVRNGAVMFVVGMLAAAVAFAVGTLLKGLA